MGGNGGNARQISDGSGGFDPEDGSGGGIGLAASGGSLSSGGPGIIPTGSATRIGGGAGNQNGGFGGGGGGNQNGGLGGGGSGYGTGGFGAGKGGVSAGLVPGGGGGGLGAGADVFVQAGGQLTVPPALSPTNRGKGSTSSPQCSASPSARGCARRRGEIAVEALAEGDLVTTLNGARPVTWIGRRHIDIAAHPEPEAVQPIRIRRDAVAPGVPARDLLVSPDHAIHLDGMPISARLLVNGASIVQEAGRDTVTYFHVELAEHAILLAEGVEAESYLDTGNRGMFENAGPIILHPDFSVSARMRQRAAATCAPLVVEEARVRPVWERLAERAGQHGPVVRTGTPDPAVRLVAGDREIRPFASWRSALIFALPPGQCDVRLISRTALPCDARPWLDDRRRPGVAVGRMLVLSGADVTEIAADDPDLADSWWDAESDGRASWRWTA